MPIDFIYIDNFRNIEKQSFNISAKYKFTLTPREEENTFNLTREESSNYCGDGFFHENISNITALIGKNGSGKSNLFYFLRYFLGQTSNIGFRTVIEQYDLGKFIIVFGDTIIHNSIDFSNHKYIKELGYEIIDTQNTGHVSLFDLEHDLELKHFQLIYYSLVFTSSFEDELKNEINISTSGIIQESFASEKPWLFRINELLRKFQFLTTYPEHPISKIPQWILIKENEKILEYQQINYSTSSISEQFKNALESYKERVKYKDENTYGILSNLAYYWADKNTDTLSRQSEEEILKHMLEAKDPNISTDPYWREFSSIEKFIALWEKMIAEKSIIHISENSEQTLSPSDHYKYEIKTDNHEFSKMLFYYRDIVFNDTYFLFDWQGLSSGEEAKLLFGGRMQHAKLSLEKKIQEDEDIPEINILSILIDEGETYLHPEWQRTYISDIIGILIFVFSEYKLQILLTSHSPFLISDLPRENIIFLKNEDGNCKVKAPERMEHTFGGNIHTLLSNAFFMENGLIGEFAKHKINELIKYIQEEDSVIKTDSEAQKIIDLVGEPIVKNKLQSMLNKSRTNEHLRKWHLSEAERLRSNDIN